MAVDDLLDGASKLVETIKRQHQVTLRRLAHVEEMLVEKIKGGGNDAG